MAVDYDDVRRTVIRPRWHAVPDQDRAVAPAGLEYVPGFLSPSEEAELTDCIYAGEWLADLSRRVQHYGYKYDYSNRRLDESARIGSLPEWLTQLTHKIRGAATDEAVRLLDAQRPFEQAIVNEYEPGQKIARQRRVSITFRTIARPDPVPA